MSVSIVIGLTPGLARPERDESLGGRGVEHLRSTAPAQLDARDQQGWAKELVR